MIIKRISRTPTSTSSQFEEIEIDFDLRDYFAGQAIGLFSIEDEHFKQLLNKTTVSLHSAVANFCYALADAMLKRREKKIMPISILATEILFNLKTIWKYGMNVDQISALVRHANNLQTCREEVEKALNELERLSFIRYQDGLYFSKD